MGDKTKNRVPTEGGRTREKEPEDNAATDWEELEEANEMVNPDPDSMKGRG